MDGSLASGGLDALLQDPRIWRGEGLARSALPAIPTGFPELDALLPGGGWPRGALTEITPADGGVDGLSLLLPALARLGAGEGWLAWVTPPWQPYAPALAAAGLDLARILWVRVAPGRDSLWAAEQALASGACSACLAWPGSADPRALRRLQLAAERGGAWGVVFAPPGQPAPTSPAPLRMALHRRRHGLGLEVLKRRGGRPVLLGLEDRKG